MTREVRYQEFLEVLLTPILVWRFDDVSATTQLAPNPKKALPRRRNPT